MIVNIFLNELKSYRKSMIIWTVSLSLLVILFISIFPSFTKDIASSQQVLLSLPAAVRSALDISLKNFFTIYGFFAYLFTFVALTGAIQAMNLGVSSISKEDSGKTADFLLTKPVSRSRVITNKLLASICIILATNIIFSSVALIAAGIATNDKFDPKIFLLISGSLFLIQIFFIALGTLFSVIIPKIKSVITVSLPTVFAFFIIGTLGSILGNDNVRYITPFKFFDPTYIINNGSYEIKFLVIEGIFFIAAIVSSYIIYIKKDIRSAS